MTKQGYETGKRMTVSYWPIAEAIPYARNARVVPDSAVAKVAASIREFGFKNPILVSKDGTIIAAEKAGRRCFAMELSPAFCEVAVKRWENYTGETATLDTQDATS
jgi:hypothetical protein